MQTYTVWTKNGFGVSSTGGCLRNINGDYVDIKTGTRFNSSDHYHGEQLKAKIVFADGINQTGMLHLYSDESIGTEENRRSWKSKYVGCFVTVERAHRNGELMVYRCLELGDYWSSNEIELL